MSRPSKRAAATLRLQQRQALGLRFRLTGASLAECVEAMRQEIPDLPAWYDPSCLWKDLQRAMESRFPDMDANREAYRALEVARCDELQSRYYAQALQGNTKALEATLRLMAHRSRLLGLDQTRDAQIDPKMVEEFAKFVRALNDAISFICPGEMAARVFLEMEKRTRALALLSAPQEVAPD